MQAAQAKLRRVMEAIQQAGQKINALDVNRGPNLEQAAAAFLAGGELKVVRPPDRTAELAAARDELTVLQHAEKLAVEEVKAEQKAACRAYCEQMLPEHRRLTRAILTHLEGLLEADRLREEFQRHLRAAIGDNSPSPIATIEIPMGVLERLRLQTTQFREMARKYVEPGSQTS